MNAEYTPTTVAVRNMYALAGKMARDERLAEFDRWLAQHDEQVVYAAQLATAMVIRSVNGRVLRGAEDRPVPPGPPVPPPAPPGRTVG